MCTLSGGSRLTAVVVYQKNDGFKFEMALNMHDLSIQEAVIDFKQVSKLVNNSDDELNIFIETLSAPHRAPSNLPSGKKWQFICFFSKISASRLAKLVNEVRLDTRVNTTI